MKDEASLLRLLIRQIIAAEQVPAPIRKCPICGGELRIYAERYMDRSIGKMLLMQVNCSQCEAAFASQHIDPLPKWVDDLPE